MPGLKLLNWASKMKSTKKKASKENRREVPSSRVQEHPSHKYGSKASMVHSPVRTEFSPGKTVERVSKGLPFGELEALRGEIDEPLESLARYLSISRSTLQRRRGILTAHPVGEYIWLPTGERMTSGGDTKTTSVR